MLSLALLLDSSPAAADPLPLPAAPRPPELGNFVQNEAAAVQLGKALFWDTQVGSDGRTACATCHFHAGTDARVRNTINPKGDGFQVAGPDGTVTAADFPFHRLADPDDTHSAVLFDTNDVVGAQGVAVARFIDITPGVAEDRTDPFPMAGLRQVTGLNTPSVVNAVFNHRNFWNGRAQFEFNGVSPFGRRDPNARVLRFDSGAGTTALVGVILTNASLASQAVGPPNNQVEMAAEGRSFAKLGKKMLSLQPLGRQAVAADDSVLAAIRHSSGTGLSTSYSALIQAAFKPQWWASGVTVDANGNRVASPTPGSTNQFSQTEFNFSLFWGLSIQLYETTLVANQTRFDKFLAGNFNALNTQEQEGLGLFNGKGQCDKCHSGPELTRASVAQVTGSGLVELINLADGARGIPADTGFFNTGVRPTAEEVGVGGFDPFGNPLSEARRANPPPARVAADGAVKTPQLRNIELTAPYMHNGGMLTLEQVVDFYSRRGDFIDTNAANASDEIRDLGLTDTEKAELVAFLKALTDERVRFERAPFDHPAIDVPQGNGPVLRIPAVGKNGRATPPGNFPHPS